MVAKVKLVKIDTREARAKLQARGQPYYVELLNGLHLGYRKGARRGVFVMRRWCADHYEVTTLDGRADDIEPADGVCVLSFNDARVAVLKLAGEADRAAKAAPGNVPSRRTKTQPYLTRDAVEAYLAYLDRERKSGAKSRGLANVSILPKLGDVPVRDLTREISGRLASRSGRDPAPDPERRVSAAARD